MVMKAVNIADLKSHLSRHLRAVRSGHPLTVMDRKTAVARLVPYESGDDLVIAMPEQDAPPVGRVALPSRIRVAADVVEVLLAERQNHR
jgi:prevent-host-death family protein